MNSETKDANPKISTITENKENTSGGAVAPDTAPKPTCASKIKKILPTNWTLLAIFTAIIGYAILDANTGSYDSDMWWILATGREILENGIPYTNPWAMFDNLNIVIQQWLYSVILYGTYSHFGFFGIRILVFLVCVIFTFVLFGVCRIITGRKTGSGEVFAFAIAIAIFSLSAYLSERPHVYSMIFYVLIVGILEVYRRKNDYLILFALPIITCIHVNIHSAMAPFDLAIIVLYLIPNIPAIFAHFKKPITPAFYLSDYKRLPLLVALIVSALTLLINPYSIQGATYVLLSYDVANYGNYISEMGSTDFWSSFGIPTMAMIVLGSIAIGKRGLRHIDVPITCLFIGCIPVSMMHTRNVWLVSLFAILLFVSAYKDICVNNEKIAKFVSNKAFHITFIVVLALVSTGWYATQKWIENAENAEQDNSSVPQIAMDYLDEYVAENNVEKSSLKIYNPFNCGGYMEWRGYKVYMDQRPELWEPNIAGGIVHYYKNYVDAQDSTESASRTVSTYNFDFCIAFTNSKMETHLSKNSTYKKVVSGTGYSLYARSNLNAEVREEDSAADIDDLKATTKSGAMTTGSV